MVVEQKFKVLRKAEKKIYQILNSNLRDIEKNSAEFRKFAENSRAWHTLMMRYLYYWACLVAFSAACELNYNIIQKGLTTGNDSQNMDSVVGE